MMPRASTVSLTRRVMASDELDEGWKPADLVLVLGSRYCSGLDLGLSGRCHGVGGDSTGWTGGGELVQASLKCAPCWVLDEATKRLRDIQHEHG